MYPWHSEQFNRLLELYAQRQLPHALLLCGVSGSGVDDFVAALVAALICRQQDESADGCGHCEACLQHRAGSYPDCTVLTPDADARTVLSQYPPQQSQQAGTSRKRMQMVISVDQIRELIRRLEQTSHYGGYKIAVIMPAEAMTVEAANALLKILEEPPIKTLFLLVSEQPLRLLATTRSRCHQIHLPNPGVLQVIEWLGEQYSSSDIEAALTLTAGAPGLAEEILKAGELKRWIEPLEQLSSLLNGDQTVIEVATAWEKQDRAWLTRLLQVWIYQLVSSLAKSAEPRSGALSQQLRRQRERVNLASLFELLARLNTLAGSVGMALNNRLVWEEVLILWQDQCRITTRKPART